MDGQTDRSNRAGANESKISELGLIVGDLIYSVSSGMCSSSYFPISTPSTSIREASG